MSGGNPVSHARAICFLTRDGVLTHGFAAGGASIHAFSSLISVRRGLDHRQPVTGHLKANFKTTTHVGRRNETE